MKCTRACALCACKCMAAIAWICEHSLVVAVICCANLYTNASLHIRSNSPSQLRNAINTSTVRGSYSKRKSNDRFFFSMQFSATQNTFLEKVANDACILSPERAFALLVQHNDDDDITLCESTIPCTTHVYSEQANSIYVVILYGQQWILCQSVWPVRRYDGVCVSFEGWVGPQTQLVCLCRLLPMAFSARTAIKLTWRYAVCSIGYTAFAKRNQR